jgi:hypothetical protein
MPELSMAELEQYVIERNCNWPDIGETGCSRVVAEYSRGPAAPQPASPDESPAQVVERLISSIALNDKYLPSSPDLTIAKVQGYGLQDLRDAADRRRSNASYFGRIIGVQLKQPHARPATKSVRPGVLESLSIALKTIFRPER